MPSHDLMVFLIAAAARLSGYPEIPVEALPPIRALPVRELSAVVCPQDPSACTSLAATFETERYEILIRDTLDLDDVADNSFLLHELVHVLQWKQHGDAIFANCEATLVTESEAYRAQNLYLKREGAFLRFGETLAFTTCAADTRTLFPNQAWSQNGTTPPPADPAAGAALPKNCVAPGLDALPPPGCGR